MKGWLLFIAIMFAGCEIHDGLSEIAHSIANANTSCKYQP
jgi:hypothetical protein